MQLLYWTLVTLSTMSLAAGTATSTTPSPCSTTPVQWPSVVPEANTTRTRNVGVVLFRTFTMLDIYGPLNALNSLALRQPLNLFLLSHDLEPVSTEPYSSDLNPASSNFWLTLPPTHTFSDAPDLDVLIVPGGHGWEEPDLQAHVDYISETYPTLEYLVTVCVGSILAARAGVLDGKNATTNKRVWDTTKKFGPSTNWVPSARWVVDGNIWTSSGVSAGIDVTLAWINHVYGTEVADSIAHSMEYDAHKDSSWDPFSDYYNVTSAEGRVVRYFDDAE